MSVAEELAKLAELHQRGVLSDDEFTRAKARVIDAAGRPAGAAPGAARPELDMTSINSLRRSRVDRWVGGVCGGIGALTGVASWIWRVLFVLLVICAGSGVLLYLLLWLFVPEEYGPAVDAPRPVQSP